MNRQELIEKIMWNGGGMGYGITPVGTMLMMASFVPESREKDWKSVVTVSGPPDKYTDEELEKLVKFSERRTAYYDLMFKYRYGCNLICINKYNENSWMRKRMSWESGPMFSETLDEAIKIFEK